MAYIYQITCTVTNKHYIGKTKTSLAKRIERHLYDCKRSTRKTKSLLYDAILKYGWHSFTYRILEKVNNKIVDQKEREYIKQYGNYNIAEGGSGGNTGVKRGKKYIAPEIQNKIISDYLKFNSIKDIAIKYNICMERVRHTLVIHNILIRKHQATPISRSKMRIARTGVSRSTEFCKKMSVIRKKASKGICNNSWKGFWCTPCGMYETLSEAAANNNISKPTLSRLCKNSHVTLNNHMIKLNPVLQQLGATSLTIPADLGFNFIHKGGPSY